MRISMGKRWKCKETAIARYQIQASTRTAKFDISREEVHTYLPRIYFHRFGSQTKKSMLFNHHHKKHGNWWCSQMLQDLQPHNNHRTWQHMADHLGPIRSTWYQQSQKPSTRKIVTMNGHQITSKRKQVEPTGLIFILQHTAKQVEELRSSLIERFLSLHI